MKQKITNKLIKLEDIELNSKIYPRTHVDWVTRARYIKAMSNGDVFPKIAVAVLNKKLYLVDGAHRMEAMKALKETHAEAEILIGLTEQEIFVEAVRRNIGHGRQFSTQEVTQICITLEAWNLSSAQIATIVRIPATEIKPFVAKRMARIVGQKNPVALKAPLSNLAGQTLLGVPQQSGFTGGSQVGMIDNVVVLLQNDLIDSADKAVMSKLKKVYNLLVPFFAEEETS